MDALLISTRVAHVVLAAQADSVDDVRAWARIARDELSRLDTVGCLLDPTGYREQRPPAEATARIAEAWLAFVELVDEVKAP